ncbi:MAG: DUF4359 domain-containing protein [Scytolyngbya sp. HA4215-MV1]|jgi:hypothetical protein|nr:DUF4359 domain-containing protein [Scytolyngbya sp. HA4215-MV1]
MSKLMNLLAFGVITSSMVVTNPSEEVYVNYFVAEMPNAVCKEVNFADATPPNQAQDIGMSLCRGAFGIGNTLFRQQLREKVKQETKHHNFGVYSIYSTQLSGRSIKTIGAFGNFLTFTND